MILSSWKPSLKNKLKPKTEPSILDNILTTSSTFKSRIPKIFKDSLNSTKKYSTSSSTKINKSPKDNSTNKTSSRSKNKLQPPWKASSPELPLGPLLPSIPLKKSPNLFNLPIWSSVFDFSTKKSPKEVPVSRKPQISLTSNQSTSETRPSQNFKK